MTEGKFMEHTPGSDTAKAGKLLIMINGHLQSIGSDPNVSGVEYAKNNFSEMGYEILHFRVGLVGIPGYDQHLIEQLTVKIIFDRLNKLGHFDTAPDVQKMGMFTYSHGGGTAVLITQRLENSEFTNIPIHLVMIDAVQLGAANLGLAVTVRPPVTSMFNRYQTNDVLTHDAIIQHLQMMALSKIIGSGLLSYDLYRILATGEPASGSALIGLYSEIDDQLEINNSTHLLIDDDPMVREAAINFIISNLNND